MSYILDALKKSEAERNRDAGPTLLSAPGRPPRRQTVATILIALLALNAIVIGAWLLAPRFMEDQPPGTIPGASRPAPQIRPHRPTPQAAPDEPAVATRTIDALPASPPAPRARTVPPAAEPPPRLITPSGPPRFEISTHVYADDPTFRAITIAGQRYTEGDTLSGGWRLASITETGVVVERNGERVVMDVLQDWRD